MKKYEAKIILKRNGEVETFRFNAPTDKSAENFTEMMFPSKHWKVEHIQELIKVNQIKVLKPCLN